MNAASATLGITTAVTVTLSSGDGVHFGCGDSAGGGASSDL